MPFRGELLLYCHSFEDSIKSGTQYMKPPNALQYILNMNFVKVFKEHIHVCCKSFVLNSVVNETTSD